MTQENVFKFENLTLNRKYVTQDEEIHKKWNGPFTFIQAADTQFGLIDNYIYKKEIITWDKEIHYLRLVIQDINKLNPKPKFFIICGDLVDAFPTQVNLRKAQVNDLKMVLQELDPEIKIVCLCGNHDVGNKPTEETVASYRKEFGDDYYSFWHGGVKFIALNSQFFLDGSLVPNLKIEQEEWLDNELKKNSWKHLLLFQHIPWFFNEPNEPDDGYFNIPIKERLIWLDKLHNSGVSKVFCGHYHRNAGGFYKNMEIIVTTAVGAQLGSDKHGYRIVEVTENQVNHKYVAVSESVN